MLEPQPGRAEQTATKQTTCSGGEPTTPEQAAIEQPDRGA
jgi:hypothetical protein